MSFADLRVSRKIAIAVAVPVLIFISVGMTSWYATRVISQEADANALAYSRLHLLDLTFTGLVEEQNAVRAYVASQDPTFLARARGLTTTTSSHLPALRPRSTIR